MHARHHDDGPVSQIVRHHGDDAGRPHHGRRHETKGSGMIEPRMATMIGVLTTDARIEPAVLARALRRVVDETFNAITVDGECSTNDCVCMLASGRSTAASWDARRRPGVSGGLAYGRRPPGARNRARRRRRHQARHDPRHRRSRASHADAWLAARNDRQTVRRWSRRRIHGGDPNWGRLVAGRGRSGAAFVLDRASVAIGDVPLFVTGVPHDERADAAARVLQAREIRIAVDLGTAALTRPPCGRAISARSTSASMRTIGVEWT